MNNIFKKYTQRENIDYFMVQLFAVFTTTFFVTLLVLNMQQSPSADEILQSAVHLARNDSSSSAPPSKRLHTIPVVQSSSKVNAKTESLDYTSQHTQVKNDQNSRSVASTETLTSDKKEITNETLAAIRVDGSVDNDNLQASIFSNQQSGALAVNAVSPFTSESTGNAFVQVTSLSASQNAATNQSVSSSNSSQNSPVARSSTNRSSLINNNSQQNSTLQTQTSNQDLDDDGDQSLEVLGLGATSAGVTNGTRLDGSVRRECPPLDRFLERDRDRVVNIQRSLGCII